MYCASSGLTMEIVYPFMWEMTSILQLSAPTPKNTPQPSSLCGRITSFQRIHRRTRRSGCEDDEWVPDRHDFWACKNCYEISLYFEVICIEKNGIFCIERLEFNSRSLDKNKYISAQYMNVIHSLDKNTKYNFIMHNKYKIQIHKCSKYKYIKSHT